VVWKTVPGLFVLSLGILAPAPAAALNADYWRSGWRTPLGDELHIYEFVIRGTRVTGVYCRNCSDATTIGFIDGTWDEKAGVNFTVTFAAPAGRILSADDQHAMLVDGRLIVTGVASIRNGKALTLVKDPRGADPGGAPAYHLPPGTPPALPTARPTGGGGGGGGRGVGAAPYWQAGPFKTLRPSDLVGTWIASFGLGMNRQLFTFLLVGDRLRGVVCGRCDNPYTIGAMENIIIAGDRLYFDIVHQDWGEIDPPTFDRSIVAQVVQNEMIAAILGNVVVVDPASPPARPKNEGRGTKDTRVLGRTGGMAVATSGDAMMRGTQVHDCPATQTTGGPADAATRRVHRGFRVPIERLSRTRSGHHAGARHHNAGHRLHLTRRLYDAGATDAARHAGPSSGDDARPDSRSAA